MTDIEIPEFGTAPSSLQELTFNEADAVLDGKILTLVPDAVKAFGLKDDEGLFTGTALLLSDQCPFSIKVAVYKDKSKFEFLDKQEFTGSLLSQARSAYDYLTSLCHKNASVQREYPGVALRSALVNALIHRNYNVRASIMINVYPDRIEILSAGGIVEGLTLKMCLQGFTMTRNDGLAAAFKAAGFAELLGSGLRRLNDHYKGSAIRPEITGTQSYFAVTLPDLAFSGEPQESFSPGDEEQHILKTFAGDKAFTRIEAQNALGTSPASATRIIRKMLDHELLIQDGRGPATKYRVRQN